MKPPDQGAHAIFRVALSLVLLAFVPGAWCFQFLEWDARLDTLAAAYAETGQFAKAGSTQEAAIEPTAEGEVKEDRKTRLKLYKSNAPFREGRLEDSLFCKTRSKTDSANGQNQGTSL